MIAYCISLSSHPLLFVHTHNFQAIKSVLVTKMSPKRLVRSYCLRFWVLETFQMHFIYTSLFEYLKLILNSTDISCISICYSILFKLFIGLQWTSILKPYPICSLIIQLWVWKLFSGSSTTKFSPSSARERKFSSKLAKHDPQGALRFTLIFEP